MVNRRRIGWEEDDKGNTLALVKALIRLAGGELSLESPELEQAIEVIWESGGKLLVSGAKKVENPRNRQKIVKDVGTTKQALLQLLNKAGNRLKLPRGRTDNEDNQLEEILNVIECLKQIGVCEENGSLKNQGYRKLSLSLKGCDKIKENLQYIENKWIETAKTKISSRKSSTSPHSDAEEVNQPNFWREVCNKMLEPQRRLSSNSLLHVYEDGKFDREQIYVPLTLVERKKPDKREEGVNPEAGTKLYEPNYEEKQRFEHEAFLEQILASGEGKTKGKRIALIGEPGAGKTTLLQTIADWVLARDLGLPIWISLADLGQQATLNIWDYLQSTWLSFATSPTQKNIAETELVQQIEQGQVWLLLDGVDKVATSGIQTLQAIDHQLSGWLAQSRVILTCRLNVWEADKNALADFETYRLLDFDYPQQVHQFIDNWFSKGDAEKKKRLKAELDNAEKVRLRNLIQNPLRLTLLCASWQSQEGNLPDTKAGLYAQFVDQFYKWKSDRFSIIHEEKRSLNEALGRLAFQDIDSGTTRFCLRESFIREAMGDDSLFEKALQLGWLNNVGIAAESPTQEKVYAFFHASFEEYFAALAINDWDYFVPRNHVDKPVEDKLYRIFEPQWKEVILLWLGREDVKKEEKEGFIEALVKFDDGCGEWNVKRVEVCVSPSAEKDRFMTTHDITWLIAELLGLPGKEVTRPQVDRGFYEYRAYFIAAMGIAEFTGCSLADDIVMQIVEWSFGSFCGQEDKQKVVTKTTAQIEEVAEELLGGTDRSEAIIAWVAQEILVETDRRRAIVALEATIGKAQDKDRIFWNAAETLATIDPGNAIAIAALVALIGRKQGIWFSASSLPETLRRVCSGNSTVIAVLERLIGKTQDEKTLEKAAETLGAIDPSNSTAISAFETLIGKTQDEDTLWSAAWNLEEINPGNTTAAAAFEAFIFNAKDERTRWDAVEILGQIDPENTTVIAALEALISKTHVQDILGNAVERLEQVVPENSTVIAALKALISKTHNRDILLSAAWSLGKIDPENSTAIAALEALISSEQDELTRCNMACMLGEMNPGNPIAIETLVALISNAQDEDTRREAVLLLEFVGSGNPTAIEALVTLIGKTQDEITHRQALLALGKIGSGNPIAIETFVMLISNAQQEETLHDVLTCSFEDICSDDPTAIAALVKLIGNAQYERLHVLALDILNKILVNNFQIAEVVTDLKNRLSDEAYNNDFDQYDLCHEVIWHYAQTLTYPEFYQAWHNPPITLHPEVPETTAVGFTPTVQTLDRQITDLCNQLNHSSCICINAQTFADMTDTAEIAQELCNQIFLKLSPDEIPAVTNAPQLRRHLIPLRQQTPNLALILYNSDSEPALLRFCRQLTDILPIAWITDSPLEPPLRGFPPQQPNLLSAIQAWLEEIEV